MRVESQEWRDELLAHSDLVQDSDAGGSEVDAQRRFARYVELVEMVTGTESRATFQALIDSIRVPDDYGAYESVHNALWRFPPDKLGAFLVPALPDLIRRMAPHDQVARFLCPLSDSDGTAHRSAFTRHLKSAPSEDRNVIQAFLHDNREWFDYAFWEST